jgi:hypothetical protein
MARLETMSVNLKALEADDQIDRAIAVLDVNAMTGIEAQTDAAIALACSASERSHERSLLVWIGNLCTPKNIIAVENRRGLDALVVNKRPRI